MSESNQVSNEIVNVTEDAEYAYVEMAIGRFPRTGTAKKDKNGANVFAVMDAVDVLTYKDGQPAFSAITELTVEDACDTAVVKTRTREVIVSTNESLAVFDSESGTLVKAAPKDSIGKWVPVVRKDPRPFGKYGTKELGWLVGMYISDGWATPRMIGLAKKEAVKRNKFIELARKEISDNFVAYTYTGKRGVGAKLGDSIKVHLNGPEISDWFNREAFIATPRAEGLRSAICKQIPPRFLHKGSEEFLWGILSGLLDGDGSVICNMVTGQPRFSCRLSTSSPYLVESCKELCFRLGLRFSVVTTPPRGHSRTAYTFCFSTSDMCSRLDDLLLVGEREQRIAAQWKETGSDPRKGKSIPIGKHEATNAASLIGTANMTAYSAFRKAAKKGTAGIETVLKHEQLFDANGLAALVSRAKAPIDWEQVAVVEPAGKRQVFDFEVKDTKVFAVNRGLIIWDTLSLSVPSTPEAITAARTHMMPSKNLISARNDSPMFGISQDYLAGLHFASRGADTKKPVQTFKSAEDVEKAWRDGKLDIDTPVDIRGT